MFSSSDPSNLSRRAAFTVNKTGDWRRMLLKPQHPHQKEEHNRDAQRTNTETGTKRIGGEGGPVKDRGEREKRQWVNHDRGSAMADRHLTWKNGTICFCLAPVDHILVLRLRREKLHALSPKTRKSLTFGKKNNTKKEKFPKTSSVTQTCVMLDIVFLNLCFQPTDHSLLLAKLTWICSCYLYWKTLL